jgi:tetratricopeptide (TPR) repeat protein
MWLTALAIALTFAVPLRGQPVQEVTEGTRALYRGDYQEARTLASRYLETHPQAAMARILLARAEIAQGHYEPAYQSLRKALELDPTNIDALYYLERLCTILSQIEFHRLLEEAPDSFRAHQFRAESYLALHDKEEAEKEYQAALKTSPASVEILDALGELKRSESKFEEALEYYTRATKLVRRDYTSAYGAGACYLFKQDPQRAIENFRRALTIDPGSAAAHLALGDALLREGQTSAAVTELKVAVALIPDMRQAYTLLVRAYQKLGQTAEAQEALRKEQELAQQEIKARENVLVPDHGPSPSVPH